VNERRTPRNQFDVLIGYSLTRLIAAMQRLPTAIVPGRKLTSGTSQMEVLYRSKCTISMKKSIIHPSRTA